MSKRRPGLVLVVGLLAGILLLSSTVLAQEKINIRFPVWCSAPFHRATLTPHIMRFNKAHPNIYVDIKYMSWEEINKMVQRAGIIGKLDAEVIQAESNHAIALAVNGFSEPLNDFLTDPWNQYLYEQTPENVWNAWTYKGDIIGWAYNMHGGIIVYNTKVAEKYGVNPKDIASWDDFRTAAQKFTVDTSGDGQTDVWGFVPNLQQPNTAYREVLANLAVGNGGEFLVEENGKYYSRVAGENVIQAAQFLSDLRHKYKVIPPEVMGFDRKGMIKAAGEEKVGFTQVMAALGVYFGKEGWFEGVDWQYDLRAIPWPVGPQGTESAYGGAFGGWVINKRRSEEVKDASKELLRHMIHEAYKGALMGNRPVYSWGLEVYKLMGPLFRDTAEITEKYIFSVQLPIPEGRSVQDMIGRRVQELFAKTEVTNISEVWENLDQEITTVLKESGHQ